MKKSKFIVGALVLSMGLLGTGYAYWTDALNVSTTVQTGKLDIEVEQGKSEYYYQGENEGTVSSVDGNDVYTSQDNMPSAEVNEDGTNITINIPNMHPGTVFNYEYDITNNSTMPVIAKTSLHLNKETTGLGELVVNMDVVEDGEIIKTISNAEGAELGAKIVSAMQAVYGEGEAIQPSEKTRTYRLMIRAPYDIELEQDLPNQLVEINTTWHQENDHNVNPIKNN